MNMASGIFINASLVDDRGTWTVRARVPDPVTGKKRNKSKSTGLKVADNTKRAAERAKREIVEEWERELNSPPPSPDPPFREYVNLFLESKENSCRSNTVNTYRGYADNHILPALGNIPIKQLRYRDIQSYCDKAAKTQSSKSIRKHLVVISGAMQQAIRDGIIETDFTKYVELPPEKKFEGDALTAEQAKTLYQCIQNEREPVRAAITLGLVYGLRRSEVCGLRWSDIDFENRTMQIRNTVTPKGGSFVESEHTKTRKSRRTIRLVESTVPYLEALKKSQRDYQKKTNKVCAWPDGRPVRPDYLCKALHKVCEKNDLPEIRFHDLRHTAATLLSGEMTPKQVQAFLGHEDISTTMNVYVHSSDSDRAAVAETMDSILATK